MRVKCFDVVDAVIQEANEKFAPTMKINGRYYDTLKNYCSVIDSLAEEFGGESFEVKVDEAKMTVSIKMECLDITIKRSTHKFYSLLRQTQSFDFYSDPETGNLIVEFVFPSLWSKVV